MIPGIFYACVGVSQSADTRNNGEQCHLGTGISLGCPQHRVPVPCWQSTSHCAGGIPGPASGQPVDLTRKAPVERATVGYALNTATAMQFYGSSSMASHPATEAHRNGMSHPARVMDSMELANRAFDAVVEMRRQWYMGYGSIYGEHAARRSLLDIMDEYIRGLEPWLQSYATEAMRQLPEFRYWGYGDRRVAMPLVPEAIAMGCRPTHPAVGTEWCHWRGGCSYGATGDGVRTSPVAAGGNGYCDYLAMGEAEVSGAPSGRERTYSGASTPQCHDVPTTAPAAPSLLSPCVDVTSVAECSGVAGAAEVPAAVEETEKPEEQIGKQSEEPLNGAGEARLTEQMNCSGPAIEAADAQSLSGGAAPVLTLPEKEVAVAHTAPQTDLEADAGVVASRAAGSAASVLSTKVETGNGEAQRKKNSGSVDPLVSELLLAYEVSTASWLHGPIFKVPGWRQPHRAVAVDPDKSTQKTNYKCTEPLAKPAMKSHTADEVGAAKRGHPEKQSGETGPSRSKMQRLDSSSNDDVLIMVSD